MTKFIKLLDRKTVSKLLSLYRISLEIELRQRQILNFSQFIRNDPSSWIYVVCVVFYLTLQTRYLSFIVIASWYFNS